jgi:hypothetical protein
MQRMRKMLCVAVGGGVLLLVGVAAQADTIVLKNGRRIVAMNVREVGDKVKYETSAGELSLPKSIVDHVEKDGTVPGSGASSGAATLAMTPPPVAPAGAGSEVESGAVHDGEVDRSYIAKLENAARGGDPRGNASAALAHHAAAQFELSRGDMEHALTDERTALTYAPDDATVLMNVAYLHLRRSEFKQSLDYLEHARRTSPNNADIAKLAGWAYYGMNKLKQAVAEWKRALALRPDAEVQTALEKAQRDQQEEESYKENESSHFTLRYNGTAEPALAREVLRTLEAHFSAISSELNFTPPDSIGVVLYTQQAYEDITRAPRWASALNDGRIRVPVQGLTGVTPELSRVLKHELTHSFVTQKTRAHAPTWLQEGLAQWMEGKRSEGNAALAVIFQDGRAPSLDSLEGSWSRLPADAVGRAYAWSLATIEGIVASGGMSDIERILDKLAKGISAEEAIREVLRSSYDDLMQSTAEYLRKNYAH